MKLQDFICCRAELLVGCLRHFKTRFCNTCWFYTQGHFLQFLNVSGGTNGTSVSQVTVGRRGCNQLRRPGCDMPESREEVHVSRWSNRFCQVPLEASKQPPDATMLQDATDATSTIGLCWVFKLPWCTSFAVSLWHELPRDDTRPPKFGQRSRTCQLLQCWDFPWSSPCQCTSWLQHSQALWKDQFIHNLFSEKKQWKPGIDDVNVILLKRKRSGSKCGTATIPWSSNVLSWIGKMWWGCVAAPAATFPLRRAGS